MSTTRTNESTKTVYVVGRMRGDGTVMSRTGLGTLPDNFDSRHPVLANARECKADFVSRSPGFVWSIDIVTVDVTTITRTVTVA